MRSSINTVGILLYLGMVSLCLAFWGLVFYVAYHFISKLW